jgi:hypothetical protein
MHRMGGAPVSKFRMAALARLIDPLAAPFARPALEGLAGATALMLLLTVNS